MAIGLVALLTCLDAINKDAQKRQWRRRLLSSTYEVVMLNRRVYFAMMWADLVVLGGLEGRCVSTYGLVFLSRFRYH